MIFDTDHRPKGVVLIRIPRSGIVTIDRLTLADYIPLLSNITRQDPRQWRPDGVMSSQADWSSEVAGSPLADGSVATNHVRRNPTPFTFDAVITDTPLVPFGNLGGLPGFKRADAILAGLLDVWSSRSFVTVVSPTLVLSTAVVTRVSQSRSPEDGSAYYVSVTVQEVRTFAIRQLTSVDDAASQLGAARTVAGGGIVWGG